MIKYLLGCFFLICGMAEIGAAVDLKTGLLFYVPFEENADALVAGGNKKSLVDRYALEKGRVGNGVNLEGKDNKLEYSHVGNYEITCGTVAFWVKPAWEKIGNTGNKVFFRGGHVTLALQGKRAFFMTGGSLNGDDFAWDYNLFWDGFSQWQSGQWQHVALVWDRATEKKAIYINGQKKVESHCRRFPANMGDPKLLLGDNLSASFDEFIIWNRMLAPEEIKQLAADPVKIAEILGNDIPKGSVADHNQLAAGLVNGVSLYVPFDGDCRPVKSSKDGAMGNAATGKYVPGVVNQAWAGNLIDFSPVWSSEKGQDGTISFWLKPGGKFCELKAAERFIDANGISLNFVPGNRKLFFMTSSTENGKFSWDYNCWTEALLNWNAEDWHLVVLTWNQQKKSRSIYLDGKLAHTAPGAPAEVKDLKFGNVGSWVDELMIWNRELSAGEIAGLCAFPADVAKDMGIQVNPAELTPMVMFKARQMLKEAATAEPLRYEIVLAPPVATVVAPGETFNADVMFVNPGMQDFNGEITFILRDFYLNNCGELKRSLTLAAGQRQKMSIPCQAKKRGSYKLEASWVTNGKKKTADVSAFSCWNKRQPSNPESFFGNHINSWGNGVYLEQAAKLGDNWERNHNMLQATWWEQVQPDNGPFNWTASDQYIDQLKKRDFHVLAQIFTTPYWAAEGGPKVKSGGYNPGWKPDAKAFDRYVYETVNHYKDYIKYWEIWNEPDVPMFWKGTATEYGALVQNAAKAIHRADPSAKVCGGAVGGAAWTWLTKAAEGGALKEADIFTFHLYYSPDLSAEEIYKMLSARMVRYRGLLEKYGKGKNTPIWNSEGNVSSSTFFQGVHFPQMPPAHLLKPTWREATISTVQYHAILMALGVEKYFLYLQNPIPHSDIGIYANISSIDLNNAVKPYMVARSAMQEQLDYAHFVKLIRQEDKRLWAFVFQVKDKPETIVLLWCGEDGEMRLRADWPNVAAESVDLFGNSSKFDATEVKVNALPSYLRFKTDSALIVKALENATVAVDKHAGKLLEVKEDNAPHIPLDMPDFSWPNENPAAVFNLDLKKYCNMGLADDVVGDGKGGWSDEGELNDMRDLKTGPRKFCGVPFDLIAPEKNHGKSIISLKGGTGKSLPDKVTDIEVGRKVEYLYFLHTASWGSGAGKFGKYVINYQDGSSEEIILENPVNINDWWAGYNDKELSRPAAVKVTNTSDGVPGWRYLRVLEWRNPKSSIPVRSVDVISYGQANIIVLAITGM